MFTPDWELVDESGEPADTVHGHEWRVSRYYSPKDTDPAVTLNLVRYDWGEPAEVRVHLTLDEAEALIAAVTEAVRRQRDRAGDR